MRSLGRKSNALSAWVYAVVALDVTAMLDGAAPTSFATSAYPSAVAPSLAHSAS